MTLAIVAIFKDEADALEEWIAFHRCVGFEEFILYDNASTDGGANLVRKWPGVRIVDWNVPAGQLPAYEHYRQTYSHRHDWAAFIDVDEFIVPFDNHIGSTLARAGSHSAVILSWLCFGPNGHEVRPASLIIQAFDARLPVGHPNNFPVKSIVRVSDLLGTWSPHLHRLSGPVCNAQGETVPDDHDHHGTCHKHAVIFHYYTKSRADWADKLARGRADAIDLTPVRQWA